MTGDERWQVSDSAAENYERFVASWFAPWADDLVQRAGLAEGWRVLDVACGTGIVCRAAAPVVGDSGLVVGSDLNPGMLAEARRRAPESALIEWRQADATDLPFEPAGFDAVLCQQGLQFVPDKAAAVSEMKRVLRPTGVAAVSVWRSPEHNPYVAALASGLSRHLSSEAGESMLAPCSFGDADTLGQLFEDADFAEVRVEAVERTRKPVDAVEAIEGNLAALPMAEQVQAMEPATYAAMIDDIVALMDEYVVDGVLNQSMSVNVALAWASA